MAGRPPPPNLDDWRVKRFLEWLCTPVDERMPQTQNELAAELDLRYQQLVAWKSDVDFLSEWERRYLKTIGSVQRQQEILNQLYQTAIDRTDPRQVVAAKTYLDVIGKAKPIRPEGASRDARQLSNEALYEVLAERAANEISQK